MSPVTRSAPSLPRMPLRAALGVIAASTIAVLAGAALPVHAVALEPAPGETVVADFSASAEQYEWIVPDDITEIIVELAAGAGASSEGAAGGVGGAVTARIAVTPGQTLLVRVGAQGVTTPLMTGGEGSAVASAEGELLVVAGGGGAAFRCGVAEVFTEDCGAGGAGGYSAVSGSASGLAGVVTGRQGGINGTPGTLSGPGTSGQFLVNGTPEPARVDPSPDPAAIIAGVMTVAPPTMPTPLTEPQEGLLGGGGGGFYAGGHGGMAYTSSITFEDTSIVAGGGAGGSGYLVEGATMLELGNTTGDGYASISYVVPEPVVVEDPEPEPTLVDTPEPTLTVGAATVRAGRSLDLAGTGLDPHRAYPVILNSDPVLLGDVTTDAQGAFATTVTIPASVHPGEHVITVGAASIPITVLAADVVPQPRMAPPAPELAATGTADDLGIAGLAALTLLGLGVLVLRRARQTQHVE